VIPAPITNWEVNQCHNRQTCRADLAIRRTSEESVTWITSYVSIDHTKTFCIYDGPSPESVERAALANGLPVNSISEVRVLDPYFYTGVAS